MAKIAIVYDFDGTLARGNIQEHSFIPDIGLTSAAFWDEVKAEAERHDADEILVYMWRMLDHARRKGAAVTVDALREHGRKTPLFDGVDSWFGRIGEYASKRSLGIEHYVISSGIHEMIAGCSVFEKFKRVFASRFIYSEAGEAIWPGVAINYTTKTQFLFRINKGIDNTWDNQQINHWKPMNERPIPFSRMIFVGDGETDIPSMKMVTYQGGYSIAVFDPGKWESERSQKHIYRLIAEDRARFVVPADYRSGSQLDVTVKGIIGRVARDLGYRGRDDAD